MCMPCSGTDDPVRPISCHGICCMMRSQGPAPITPAFDAPEACEEMAAADMSTRICGPDGKERKSVPQPGVAKGLASPREPSDEERSLHCLTHVPYRSWCPYCVAGKRANSPHLRVNVERTIPMLAADYGFISDKGCPLSPTLVVSIAPVRSVICYSR